MIETCYVLEDGSVAHPRDVSRDAKGVLRHKDGRAVAMRRPNVPRTRGVDLKDMRPQQSAPGYLTRESVSEQSEPAPARRQYRRKVAAPAPEESGEKAE